MFLTPFDVVKQRMQLGYYKSVTHCIRTVLKTEGLAAFYMSFPTTLMMNIPFGGVMVAVNESVKKVLNPEGEYSISTSMIAGSIAGGVAAAVTTPLDVVKTRLQTQNLEHCTKSCEDPFFNPTGSGTGTGGPHNVAGGAGSAGHSSVPKPNPTSSSRTTLPNRAFRKGLSLPQSYLHPNTTAGSGGYSLDMGATLASRSPNGVPGSNGVRIVGGGSAMNNRQRAPTVAGVSGERRAGVLFSREHRLPNIRMRALFTGAGTGAAFPRHMAQHSRRRSIRAVTWHGFTSTGRAVTEQVVARSSLGMVDMAKQILAQEGPAAFFRGVIPRMLVHAPSVAISWTAYETMKTFLMNSN